jgi:hypothetical protein
MEQCDITRRAYALLGADHKFDVDFFDGGHVWHGTVAFDWLDRWLRSVERK